MKLIKISLISLIVIFSIFYIIKEKTMESSIVVNDIKIKENKNHNPFAIKKEEVLTKAVQTETINNPEQEKLDKEIRKEPKEQEMITLIEYGNRITSKAEIQLSTDIVRELSASNVIQIQRSPKKLDIKEITAGVDNLFNKKSQRPDYHKTEVDSYEGEYFDLDILSSTKNGCYDGFGLFKRYQSVVPSYDYENDQIKLFKCQRYSDNEYYWELQYN